MKVNLKHWDREWYQPFEKFRIRLADLINNLFKILEEYPQYIFHLDAQTIVLEDYLELYPENEEKLKGYIKSGNIIVGPWYVQNDFFLASGESTIRNILIGTKIAKKFGKCANVGYTPDQFGLCSQLPQIFKKLGIKYHIFGRGYAYYKPGNNEYKLPHDSDFYWEAPDGSCVFSVLMPYWYNNAQRFTANIDIAVKRVYEAEKNMALWSKSPYLLMMNGVDHLEAQNDLLPILDKINERLENRKIIQTSMENAIEKIEPYASAEKVKGELRYGKELDILTGTFSTRTDIKILNFNAQNMIEHKIEPLYSMIMLAGAEYYPQNEIYHMWKTLIPNHAHDSICCCSNSRVMKHMAERYLSIEEIGEELLERGCRFINNHIERNNEEGIYYFTVINTCQTAYSGVMEISFDINKKDEEKDFKIFSPEGEEIPYVIIEKKDTLHATFSPLNLPGNVSVVNYTIQVYVKDIPAFGYVNYTVRPGFAYKKPGNVKILENEYLKIDFKNNQINIYDKVNNIFCKDVLRFEDVGDNGDSYVFVPFENDLPIKAKLQSLEIVYANALKSAVKLYYTIDVPFEKNDKGRCGEIKQNKIEVIISLGKGDKAVNFDVTIENNSKYHLLRAVVNTNIHNSISYSSSVYDVIKRNSKEVDTEFRNFTQPVNGFVYKKNNKKGFAVFTKGLYEYENEDDAFLMVSLLRSVDLISRDSDIRAWAAEDNLMMGKTEVSFALMPFGTDCDIIPAMEQNINSKPLYWFDSIDTHMFVGGRPAVQDSDVDEIYYPEDEYEALKLPHKDQFINVNDKICVTALKKAENKKNVVLRMYNPTEIDVKEAVSSKKYKFLKTDLREQESQSFKGDISPKEILTLFMEK